MDQSRKEEDHKFFGLNTQQLDIIQILQDDEAFENMFFLPTSMNYNPMSINEYIDFDELHELLNEEKVNEGVHFVVGNEGGLDGNHGSNMVATQINNGDRLMNVKLTDEQNVKKWNTRKRYKKGSKDSAHMMELKRKRNRVTAARAYAEKQAYIQKLELEVQKFRKKNANLKKLLLIHCARAKLCSEAIGNLKRKISLELAREGSKKPTEDGFRISVVKLFLEKLSNSEVLGEYVTSMLIEFQLSST